MRDCGVLKPANVFDVVDVANSVDFVSCYLMVVFKNGRHIWGAANEKWGNAIGTVVGCCDVRARIADNVVFDS